MKQPDEIKSNLLFKMNIFFVDGHTLSIANTPGKSEKHIRTFCAELKIGGDIYSRCLDSIDPDWFPYGAAIDMRVLHQRVNDDVDFKKPETIRKKLKQSRIKLQGTDGIRGKISDEITDVTRALIEYRTKRLFSPALVELTAYSFAVQLIKNGLIKEGDTVTAGEDGRDELGNKMFMPALIRGFNRAHLRVLKCGALSTSGIIIAGAHFKSPVTAVLTASHNPANQNGLKLLFNHFKLLDETSSGEFALTASMLDCAYRWINSDVLTEETDVHEQAVDILIDTIINNCAVQPGDLADYNIVYDGANGAGALTAPAVFAKLGIGADLVNVKPSGENINRDGGVAELEGTSFFDVTDPQQRTLPVIRRMLERADTDERTVVGIVNDGDADRGYILIYNRDEQKIYVVPGDEIAIWIAKSLKRSGALSPDAIAVTSVESDIMAGWYLSDTLGFRNETACVGDKWLLFPARNNKPFAVGAEESGHVTFGLSTFNVDGDPIKVYTGDGLISVLRALAEMNKSNASVVGMVSPFTPGYKGIRYTYFVDQSQFYRGSEIWTENYRVAMSMLIEGCSSDYKVHEREISNCPEMLFFEVLEFSRKVAGRLFIRNSGTEKKIGVASRCIPELMPLFIDTMNRISFIHKKKMRDISDDDYPFVRAVEECLSGGSISLNNLERYIYKSAGRSLSPVDFEALLYGLRKERTLKIQGTMVAPYSA